VAGALTLPVAVPVPDVQELANTIAVASTASFVQLPIALPRRPNLFHVSSADWPN
jgi:hypothetical protein